MTNFTANKALEVLKGLGFEAKKKRTGRNAQKVGIYQLEIKASWISDNSIIEARTCSDLNNLGIPERTYKDLRRLEAAEDEILNG